MPKDLPFPLVQPPLVHSDTERSPIKERLNSWRRDKMMLDIFTAIPDPTSGNPLYLEVFIIAFTPTELLVSDGYSEAIINRSDAKMIRAARRTK